MDGNDLRKPILRCRPTAIGPDGEPIIGPAIDWVDTRTTNSNYYLPQVKVNKWEKTVLQELEAEDGHIRKMTWPFLNPFNTLFFFSTPWTFFIGFLYTFSTSFHAFCHLYLFDIF